MLAASGAEMWVGVTTNQVKKEDTEEHRGGLIALWWRAPVAPNIYAVAEAVFFDICELVHKIPDCALDRVMQESLNSTPAAPASGGQADTRQPLAGSLWRATATAT